MKACFYTLFLSVLLSAGLLPAQSNSTEYTTDINGHRVPDAASSTSGPDDKTVLNQSINGRTVPLEKTESHVIREDATGKVTEQIVHHYDANGQLASTDRTVTEEQKHGNGGSTIHATIYRSDPNGGMREGERRTIETQKQGDTTTADVTIARAGMDGSFQPVEKRKVVTTKDSTSTQENESVYRVSSGGQFSEVLRTTKEEKKVDGKTVTNAAQYEPGYGGQLQLASQKVTTAAKAANGAEVVEVNTFGFADGAARVDGGKQSLKEQQTIVRKPGPNGVVTETTTLRRPSASDPGRLGDPQVVSEKVCSGKCDTTPSEPKAAEPKASEAKPTEPAASAAKP